MSARHACLCAVLLACWSGWASADTIYQWKDANGVTHSSDKPPVGVAYEVRRIDNRASVAGRGTQATPEGRPVEPIQCTTARANLVVLQSDNTVEQEVDGKRQPLSDAQRTAQQQLAEAAIQAYCPPA